MIPTLSHSVKFRMGNFPTVRLLTHPLDIYLTQTPVKDPLNTFLPRVRPFFVLSHLCFRTSPSQFGFLKNVDHFLFSRTHKPLKNMNSVRHCHNCSILRHEIENKDKRMVDLQLQVQRLQKVIWNHQEHGLRSENEMLKKKLKISKMVNRINRSLLQTRERDQETSKGKIEAQKEKVEGIGKVMISFIYNQSD